MVRAARQHLLTRALPAEGAIFRMGKLTGHGIGLSAAAAGAAQDALQKKHSILRNCPQLGVRAGHRFTPALFVQRKKAAQ